MSRRSGEERGRGGAEPPARSSALVEWGKSLLWAVVLFLVIRTFVAESFYISSGSMEPSLLIGDVLMVGKVAYGAKIPGTRVRLPGYDEPSRGEIIIFRPEHDPEVDVVKRIVGVPGDTLRMRDGRLYVDGSLHPEPYVTHDPGSANETHPWMVWQYDHLLPGADRSGYVPSRDDWGPFAVPEDRYFVMGDNREQSLDSRYWGFLEEWRIKGKVAFLYYSFDPSSTRPLPVVFAARPGRIGMRPGPVEARPTGSGGAPPSGGAEGEPGG